MKLETLQLLQQISGPNDTIYEVFKKPKRSFLFHIWDTFFDLMPSVSDSLLNNQIAYIIASETSGKIVEVHNNEVIHLNDISNWNTTMKHSFKKVVLGQFVYKKSRIIK